MNTKLVMKIAEVAVKVAGFALPFAAGYFDNRDRKEIIRKEVAEQLAEALKQQKGES